MPVMSVKSRGHAAYAGRMSRPLALALGGAVFAVGVLWTLQGLGVVKWPASSFMISQKIWAIRGGALLLVSIVLVAAMRATPNRPAGRP